MRRLLLCVACSVGLLAGFVPAALAQGTNAGPMVPLAPPPQAATETNSEIDYSALCRVAIARLMGRFDGRDKMWARLHPLYLFKQDG